MERSRYKICEPTHPHFITCTILHWIPIFKRTQTTDIIFQSLKYLQKENIKTILEQLAFYKKAHKKQTTYQLWQEGIRPKLIQDEKMMMQKIEYIYSNPVKRGYVDNAIHWRYSSARNYYDMTGLIDVKRIY